MKPQNAWVKITIGNLFTALSGLNDVTKFQVMSAVMEVVWQ